MPSYLLRRESAVKIVHARFVCHFLLLFQTAYNAHIRVSLFIRYATFGSFECRHKIRQTTEKTSHTTYAPKLSKHLGSNHNTMKYDSCIPGTKYVPPTCHSKFDKITLKNVYYINQKHIKISRENCFIL